MFSENPEDSRPNPPGVPGPVHLPELKGKAEHERAYNQAQASEQKRAAGNGSRRSGGGSGCSVIFLLIMVGAAVTVVYLS